MLAALPLLCTLALTSAGAVEVKVEQVAPVVPPGKEWRRSPGQTRAVLLIHGFYLHFRPQTVARPAFRPWQRPDSALVKELAHHADVFAYAYGQDVSIDRIAAEGELDRTVARLRKLGYREIVLLAHSAGGLIARQFVEDHPEAGVTRLILACSPFGGCMAARVKVIKSQQPFLDCLTPDGRQRCLKARVGRRLPPTLQCVCVVGRGGVGHKSDGLVSCVCQWTEDLQKQGVPAVPLDVGHREVVRGSRAVRALADLITHDQPRWTPEQVRKAHKELFGD